MSAYDQQLDRKKKTTLGRLLKGFKTVRRKDKDGLKHTLPDRLRQQLQMNGGVGGGPAAHLSFEETIQRLKIEEAMRKREKYQKEHEEVSERLKVTNCLSSFSNISNVIFRRFFVISKEDFSK